LLLSAEELATFKEFNASLDKKEDKNEQIFISSRLKLNFDQSYEYELLFPSGAALILRRDEEINS